MENSKTSKHYQKIKETISIISIFLPFIFITLIYLCDIPNALFSISTQDITNPWLHVLIFSFLFSCLYYIITIPLSFFSSFIIEHRFALSNQSFFQWLQDHLKSLLISAIIGFSLIELMYVILRHFPTTWWIITATIWFLFNILISKIAPIIFLPLFFKQTPLQNNALSEKLLSLAQKSNTHVNAIFEIDFSKKTKKANAALCGLGKTRRILLADTLLNNYTDDEVAIIVAHELGHHAHKHIRNLLFISGLLTFLGFYLIHVILLSTIKYHLITTISDIRGLPLIFLGFSLFGIFILPLQNAYSCYLERQADDYAVKLTQNPDSFISAMEKLAEQNLSDTKPSRLIEILLYDHPPIYKRIAKVKRGYRRL